MLRDTKKYIKIKIIFLEFIEITLIVFLTLNRCEKHVTLKY